MKNIASHTHIGRSNAGSPVVSIVVPVYNSKRYLRFCVDSLIGQSYRELQIILVDDGSTDGSEAICDEYAEQDNRVVVIHQSNAGIAAAQNAGLDACNGEFIAFCDNDDLMHRQNIEHLLDAIQRSKADMAKGRWKQIGVSQIPATMEESQQHIAQGACTLIEDPLVAYESVFCKTLRVLGGKGTEARYFNEANWCRLYRRAVWQGLRFTPGHYAQDIRMAGPLYSRMRSVVDVDRVLYFWLQEPDSVTHSKRNMEFWHDNVVAAAANFEFCLGMKITPYRNYFGLTSSVRDEVRKVRRISAKSEAFERQSSLLNSDLLLQRSLLARIPAHKKCLCWGMSVLRRAENILYDLVVHSKH
ncbi:glycosyltransferase family 2 protein [Bifidobacterium psychraerophilum]|uniref:glycosyltransferase family 2 protein n=1 Tax=Bifidobacterium psychraerophilum TaxID=218140 RepID=UPI0039EA35B5